MKNLTFCCLVFAVAGCTSSVNKAPDIKGAYFMTSQTVANAKEHVTYSDLKQLKIYTDSFMMYTQVNPADSVSGFGVGYYLSDSGKIIENAMYTSRENGFSTSPASYSLTITKTPEGYTQFIPEITIDSTKSTLTEEYQYVGKKDQTTPLDGVWKETAFYVVKGNDTTRDNRTQYKAFYQGYFMFGQTIKDPSGKISTGIGFGTFVMNGDKQIKETDLNSTYSILVGTPYDVNFEMKGPDSYMQTITYPDSSKSTEVYERFKK
ncbi:MAG: hypothetical protein M3R50_12940 [Bacteroidota bacterium]|nr:hypothetical protein [Bacteroidota bacterium]